MKKKLLALVMALTVAVMGGGFTSNAQELTAKAETEAEVTAELDVKVAVTDDNKTAVNNYVWAVTMIEPRCT